MANEEYVLTNKTDLDTIADAVREATGSTEVYNVPELANAATSIINNATTPTAVLYTEQILTEEQQEQARANIGAANKNEVPSALSDLADDTTHRTVTDEEKETWNAKSDFSGSYNDLTDKTHYTALEEKTLIEETTIEIDSESGQYNWIENLGFKLVEGETYTIVYNGTTYFCVCKVDSYNDGENTYNVPYLGFSPTSMTGEEPFCFADLSELGGNFTIVCTDGSTSITFSLTGKTEVVHPIDPKYLGSLRNQKKIVFNVNTDGTVECPGYTLEQLLEMDIEELQNSIVINDYILGHESLPISCACLSVVKNEETAIFAFPGLKIYYQIYAIDTNDIKKINWTSYGDGLPEISIGDFQFFDITELQKNSDYSGIVRYNSIAKRLFWDDSYDFNSDNVWFKSPTLKLGGESADDENAKEVATKDDIIQSDWEQTNETATDFIKNKPFGGSPAETVTFDGNFEGREIVDQRDEDGVGYVYVKISDEFYTAEQLNGAKCEWVIWDGAQTGEATLIATSIADPETGVIVVGCGVSSGGVSSEFDVAASLESDNGDFKKGTYISVNHYYEVENEPITRNYLSSVELPSTIKTIDAKYLPEGLGEVFYVDMAITETSDDGTYMTFSANKTPEEVNTAYINGMNVCAKVAFSESEYYIAPLALMREGSPEFVLNLGIAVMMITYDSDDSASSYILQPGQEVFWANVTSYTFVSETEFDLVLDCTIDDIKEAYNSEKIVLLRTKDLVSATMYLSSNPDSSNTTIEFFVYTSENTAFVKMTEGNTARMTICSPVYSDDIPTVLPNPNKLTLTGAVSAEYDGSAAVTIEIPETKTPVRGTDYWTEDDKNEIITEVADKFPIIPEDTTETTYVLESSDIDTTLSQAGKVADAGAVGEKFNQLQSFVTPQMYGAIGDGTTDDTTAIQTAINSGEEVFIPKGTYKITTAIQIPNNCKITGTINSKIVGNSEISGFVVGNLKNNIRIDTLTISGCKYALDIDGFNCVFTDLLLTESEVGCYIRTAAYANYFNECSFKFNNIGIEGQIIYTSNFTDCQIYRNTNYGIKANFRIVTIQSGYIEENGIDKTSGTTVPVVGTAGIWIPNDTTYGTDQLTFVGVDFENNGECAILQENQGRAINVTFIGGQFAVINHTNTKAAIWLNVFDKVQQWLFYGTKFPESTDLVTKQIAGHPEGTWSDTSKKPTQIYTNRRFDSDNANIIQYATIDGTTANSFFVTDAEKTAWNNKSDFSGSYNDLTDVPTVPTKTSQLTNDSGYKTESEINALINSAITGAIEGGY